MTEPEFDPDRAFDPNFEWPAVVPPVEHELNRIAARAQLATSQCEHCHATLEVVARDGSLPKVLGAGHEEGCPDWQP